MNPSTGATRKQESAPQPSKKRKVETRKIVLNPPPRFQPDGILTVQTRQKQRIECFLKEHEDFKRLKVHVIPTPKEPHLIFFQTGGDVLDVLKTLKSHYYAARHVHGVHVVQGSHTELSEAVKKLMGISLESKDKAKKQKRQFRIFSFPKKLSGEVVKLVDEENLDLKDNTHNAYIVYAYWRYHYGLVERNEVLLNWHGETSAKLLPATITISRAYHKIAEVMSDPKNGPFYLPALEAHPSSSLSPPSLCDSSVSCSGYLESHGTAKSSADSEIKSCSEANDVGEEVKIIRFRALDIGASPGGWSSFLASRGGRVLALDPGNLQLSPELHQCHKLITHVPKLSLNADAEMKEHGPFDLIVCDANIPPIDCCEMIMNVSKLQGVMKEKSRIMITFKMHKKKKTDKGIRQKAIRILQQGFHIHRSYHLFSNSHREWTVLAIKNCLKENIDT
mmetsp:Transcript_20899/g.33845  ORF Transcript_20899/g.33845 Transcript_20899/m.33845 type:complete len:449 (+) Transcript_20899:243-1589(+)